MHIRLILPTARVFAELASRLQTPTVIGKILAGVLLGPSLLGWIEPVDVIKFPGVLEPSGSILKSQHYWLR